jgi:spore germination protein YaaH
MRRTLAALFAVALLVPSFVLAAAKAPAPDYERLFYYRHGERAFASLKKNYTSIDVLAPQAHTIDGAGNLSGEIERDVLRFARRKKIDVMPLVTNGAFNKTVSQIFLTDTAAQDRAIEAMVAEAEEEKYIGWQIDFEQIDASLKDELTAFVQRAADAFHEEDLLISIAVVSKVSDNPSDYPGELWQNLIGVFDYEALGEAADFISLMSYDEPYKTGPVSPYPWLVRVVDYTLGKVPASKVSMGVPLYYWEREDMKEGRIMEIGGALGVEAARKERGAKKSYSEEMETAFIKFKRGKEKRTVWYESARSIGAKLDLIEERGMRGFSAWALGLEVPETHRVFKKWGN